MNELSDTSGQHTLLITGASGMVGEGVLHVALQDPDISRVVVLGRRPCGYIHPKLTEILHPDLMDISPIADQLTGIDSCAFCLGVSSVGKSEAEYTSLTHSLTMGIATILGQRNPGMRFLYISGVGTDRTEKGRSMWARVKGRTENDLLNLASIEAYGVRPGYLHPIPGLKHTLPYYRYVSWMYPILSVLAPGSASTLEQLAKIMLNVARNGHHSDIITVADMRQV
jgi:uncharacterized protein YbjT (DUF2867 family)